VRTYQLYLIEDEFASHYFGREKMFYQLFQEIDHLEGELKMIVKKQINYITKSIPSLHIHKLLHQRLGKSKDFQIKNGTYYIEKSGSGNLAQLEVFDRFILVQAKGGYDSETVFFEVLRQCETSFLAIDFNHQRFGWLKPIKERKFV
jgi:hypothetical protein